MTSLRAKWGRSCVPGRNGCPMSSSAPTLQLRRPGLRADPPSVMLDGEDVAVESSDPLLTLHRHLEIAQGVTDIALDLAPIELWIVVNQIGGTVIAELLAYTGFGEFVVERVQLARVERIAQLPDQIRGPDEPCFRIGGGMVGVVRHRKARELDGVRNTLLVYVRNGCEPV